MAVSSASRDYEVIEMQDAQETMEYVEKYGVSNVSSHLQKKLDEWKEVPIYVGVVGESGVGKSSFINTVRNLDADDEGAAPVGVVETTTEPTPYPHPFNSKVVFWDLPGVGTPRFPQEEYLKAIDVERYDFFVILSDRRFTANDGWLAEMLLKRKKPFFFVRTKFDEAVQDQSQTADEIRDKIVRDAQRCLKALKLKGCKIYVISNFDPDRYEFPILMDSILLTLPSLKVQSMVFTLGNLCKRIIVEKKTFLKSRVWKIAAISAGAGAIPLPGVDIAVDIGLLLHETWFYMKQFGLDEESLTNLARKTKTSVDYYKNALINSKEILLTRTGISTTLKSLIVKKVAVSGPKRLLKLLPFIGLAVNATASFVTTYYFLNKLIEDFSLDSQLVLDRVTQRHVEISMTLPTNVP